MKPRTVAVSAVSLAAAAAGLLIALRPHRSAAPTRRPRAFQSPSETPAPVATRNAVPPTTANSKGSCADRILALAASHASAAEMADLLKQLYRENPDELFQALLAIGHAPRGTQLAVVPLLAEALTRWPEAEGRYLFPVADAFGDLDVSRAATWAAGFLTTTGRNDIAASSLLDRLAETEEPRALALIATVPEAARRAALSTLAYHLALGDLDHLAAVCQQMDPQNASSFSRQLFERLGAERLDDTAAWLAATPSAQRIPGAIRAIGQALVRSGNPQQAIAWADSLPDGVVRADGITAVYQAWAHNDPAGAIQDILAAYDHAPMLMQDVFQGAAEQHGSGASQHWDAACALPNSSARAYAISALITPMLLTVGQGETAAKIATLPAASVERRVAEQVYQAALNDPTVQHSLLARSQDSAIDGGP